LQGKRIGGQKITKITYSQRSGTVESSKGGVTKGSEKQKVERGRNADVF